MRSKTEKNLLIFFGLACITIFFVKVFNKRVDFPCFYLAGQRFLEGKNLYVISDSWPYKYLPSASLFFVPFSFFPYNISLVVFYLVSFFSMVLSYRYFFKNAEKENIPMSFWLVLIVFLINVKAHFYDFANLQINHILVLLLIYSFVLWKQKKDWPAALLFSIAGIFKIIPLFLAFFFLLKKDFKFVFKIVLTTIMLLLAPALRYGMSGLIEQYGNYVALMKNYHQLFSPDRLYQSLPALIARMGEPLMLSEKSMKIFLVLGLIPPSLVVLKMIWDQYKAKSEFLGLEWIQFATCLIFYPLVNPVGWKHGYVFLMPLIFLLVTYIYQLRLYRKMYFTIQIAAFLILYSFSSQLILGKRISDNKDLLSFNVWGALLLIAMAWQVHSALLKSKRQ